MNNSKAQIYMAKTIATRLHASRDLCKFSVEEAAFLLGITFGELEKIEATRSHGRHPAPHWLILTASKVYDVSVDYIFGGNEDWELAKEVCADRDILSHLNYLCFIEHQQTTKALARQNNRLKTLESTIGILPLAIKEVAEALDKFRELNIDFDDLKGGSSLVGRVKKAHRAAHAANCELIRFKCIPKDRLSDFIVD
jgi:hypothetical protein